MRNKNYPFTYLFINAAVAIYFLSIFLFNRSYNIAPALLILATLFLFVTNKERKNLFTFYGEQKTLAFSYLFYFATLTFSVLFHHGELKELDNPSRILLFLPLLPLLVNYKINFYLLAKIIPFSALFAGVIALIQRFYLGDAHAYGNIMHIQGGDMAMSLGLFSIAIGLYFWTNKSKRFALFVLFCALMGILGSILSTARGGWIGVPFVLAVILYNYRKQLPKYFFPILFSIISTFAVLVSLTNTGGIIDRINAAKADITQYMSGENTSTSVGARFDMWKASWIAIQEKPLLGWGKQGIYDKKQELAKTGIISEYSASFVHNHNQFIDNTVKQGLMGLIALLFIFIVPLRFFIRNLNGDNPELLCLSSLGIIHVISTMFYNVSQSFFAHNSGNIFYFFLIVVFYAAINVVKNKN
ncbi:O-antigen ligase family protein [Avibacterium sp. 21-599]|uniref:O-antigen ligase family protein n=1 Tax=Avibacterium sp. 21-599 TaxID=2911528 RepID=UPI002247FE8F|nr:O-antigen ligase [Avibacterium sp. 21-599]MCW9717312.1 O-antigen ligase family protein [Avibacterium sp. 21-599]